MSTIYSYQKPGRDALVDLIQTVHPRLNVVDHNIEFDEPYLAPSEVEPGRTFIEVLLMDRGVKTTFVYRRLDLAVAMGDPIQLNMNINNEVTPEKIVEKINMVRGYNLNPRDVDMSDIPIHTTRNPIHYTLKARPSSYVWYGQTDVIITLSNITGHERLLEDGTIRELEDDGNRLLETAP